MSVLTDFISQARQEDAERRKEEREERRIDREDRKLEAEERRRNEDRRDENNRMMFQTMMATILSQTGRTDTANSSTSNAPLSPTATTNNTDNANWIIESNKKRNRKNDTQEVLISPVTTQQDQFNRMEVDENVVMANAVSGQQHHDVQENNGSPLLH